MITRNINFFKPITSDIYKEFVDKLPLYNISCSCGHCGCLIRHAYYTRKLKTILGTITLRILRVKCKSCGKTHAILPESIVPYSQVPVDIQRSMITHKLGSDVLEDIMNNNYDISLSDVLHVRQKFHKFWCQRVLSAQISLSLEIKELCLTCYSLFHKQFMQIRRGSYIFFHPPT